MHPSLTRAIAMGAAALGVGALSFSPSAEAADVGVSIGISQPGVYGRIDIGRFPSPVLVAQQPVIIAAPPSPPYGGRPVVMTPAQPVYLWVPPGHRKHWHKHCHQYGACGHPVVFVRDEWYQQHVHRGPGRYGRGEVHDHDRRARGEGHRDGRRD